MKVSWNVWEWKGLVWLDKSKVLFGNCLRRPTLGPKTITNNWKPFKNDEKCFLFHAESSFCSCNIYIFVLTFCLCKKWIDKKAMVNDLWFMISQNGQHITAMHILPKISNSKGNQVMKFGQLIKYSLRNSFLPKNCRKGGREISFLDLFLFLKKDLYKVKTSGQHLVFIIFW